MNTNGDFDRHAAAWLADGPSELNDRVLDAALREVHQTPQRHRSSMPWRAPLMSLRLSAATMTLVITVAGILAFNLIGGGPNPTASLSASLAAPTAGSPSHAPAGQISEIAINGSAGYVVFAAASIWVATTGDQGGVVRVDPATNAVTARIVLAVPPQVRDNVQDESDQIRAIATDGDAVWAAVSNEQFPERDRLVRIDPATNTVAETIPMPFYAWHVLILDGTAWVSDKDAAAVGVIDLASKKVLRTIHTIDSGGTVETASGFDAVWIPNRFSRSISRVDAGTFESREFGVTGPAYYAAIDKSGVWTNCLSSLCKLDPQTGRLVMRAGPSSSNEMVVLSGKVYTFDTSGLAFDLVELDALTGNETGRQPYPAELVQAARDSHGPLSAAGGSIWVGISSMLVRYEPLAGH